MADPVRQFDDASMRRIASAVRKVEQTPIMRPSVGTSRPTPSAREIRWARITTNYNYPTFYSAGPYVIEFGEYSVSPDPLYPGATVSKSFAAYDPQWSEIAVDPSGGTHAEGDIVRVERHDGQWWIRPSAGSATHPCCFQDFYSFPSESTGIAKGDSPNYYTVAYYETLGSRTDNNCSRIDLGASGDPFTAISATGAYRIVQQVGVHMWATGSTDSTVTTSGASAGTAHTHTVATYNGKERVSEWVTYLEYRVGGSGSWTIVPNSTGYQLAVQPMDSIDSPTINLSYECYANLTSGWQIRHCVANYYSGATTTQKIYLDAARLLLHYMGGTLTADTT